MSKILKHKITNSLEILLTVFSEEYIIFKDDQFGWLRSQKRLIPLHKGTEAIIDLGVGDNPNNISYSSEARSDIPEEIVKQYKEQKIPYKNIRSIVPISISTIIEFYNKYNLSIPNSINDLSKKVFIYSLKTTNNDNWAYFSYLEDSHRYRYYPQSGKPISHSDGFAFVVSKPISFESPLKVMAYALESFQAPEHPLLNTFACKIYNILKNLYKQNPLILEGFMNSSRLMESIYERFITEISRIISFKDIQALLGEITEQDFYDYYIELLCKCDTERANIQEYGVEILSDINKGHWEIFEAYQTSMESGDILMPVPKGKVLVARDPLADVNYKASCAIDFGTKSTVVVYHTGESVLLRIGATDLWSKARLDDYENPTVINLLNYKKFMNDYNSKNGRPPTCWGDMTVSHQAANAIFTKNVDKDIYYSVFSDLKQWANSVSRRQLLNDRTGQKVELKPYNQLKKKDFDPIEIYAYYLGLNINNMHNGICVKYYLSFPVNYSLDVRNRILQSFTRGIKKSLPEGVLNDAYAMKRFKVKSGASEPAAYALSALNAYNVEPTEYETSAINTYAVFDFGGGTTDFDFGIEYIPEDKSFDYEVKQFGNGGDPLLGGENILNILAYEVYKANIEEMRKYKITIVRPNEKCSRFSGSEMLVKEPDEGDQAAYLNLKLLANLLRPIWEEQDSFESSYDSGNITCDLYSAHEERKSTSIKVDVKALQSVITKHIQDGVDNFMKTYLRTQEKNKSEWTWPLHILLAGNSSKSRILQNTLINELLEHIKLIDKGTDKKYNLTDVFRVYPPLGTIFDMNRLDIKTNGDKNLEEILSKMLYGVDGAVKDKSTKSQVSNNAQINSSDGKLDFEKKVNTSKEKQYPKYSTKQGLDTWKISRKDL